MGRELTQLYIKVNKIKFWSSFTKSPITHWLTLRIFVKHLWQPKRLIASSFSSFSVNKLIAFWFNTHFTKFNFK